MSALSGAAAVICYTAVAVTLLSVLIPQKRMTVVFGFVLGIFFLSTVCVALKDTCSHIEIPQMQDAAPSDTIQYDSEYTDLVAGATADYVVEALRDLLLNEGIAVEDITVVLKISENDRIYVSSAVIYITSEYQDVIPDIKSIVYRNIAKEPTVCVIDE